MKSNSEVSQLIFEKADIQHENPLKYYKMLTDKVNRGGFSRVFKCKRIVDGKKFAMKLAEPKDQEEKSNVVNEIGIMKTGSGPNVLKCIQAFYYRDRFWIILELMDSSFTPMITEMQGKYSEGFCKYTLH